MLARRVRTALAALLAPRRHPAWAFAVQVAVSAAGMVVGAGMLAAGGDPAVYLPVVTSIVGYWLPAPRAPPAPECTRQSSEGSVCGRGCAEEKNDD